MEKIRKYGISFLALLGLLGMFFPLAESGYGNVSYSAIGWLRYWKQENMVLAVWLCVLVVLLAGIPLRNGFRGSRAGKRWIGRSALVVLVSLPLMFWLEKGKFEMPAAGGIFTMVCALLIFLLAIFAPVPREDFRKVSGEPPAAAGQRACQSQDLPVGTKNSCRQGVGSGPAVSGEPHAAEAQEVPPGVLLVGCGEMQGMAIPLEHMQTLTIGREASLCNLVIGSPAVSRQHCMVSYDQVKGTYQVIDLSSNGTYLLGGKRLPKETMEELPGGTEIYLGTPENRFHLGYLTTKSV